MKRSRVSGKKFEQELEAAISSASYPAYYIRLHTPQARQANVRNIADFILYGKNSTILEVKETGEKFFSLNTIQQKEELEKFKAFFERAKIPYNFSSPAVYPYRLAVLVHFINYDIYTLYYLDDNPFKVVHPNDDDCISTKSHKEMIEYIIKDNSR